LNTRQFLNTGIYMYLRN